MVPKKKQTEALKAEKLEAVCKKQGRARNLAGVRCRMAIHRGVTRSIGLKDERAVKKQIKAARDALAVAASISSYKPVAKKPGHRKAVYAAHRSACAVALDVNDTLAKMPADAPEDVRAAAKKALAGTDSKPGLFQRACECARDTIALSDITTSEADKGKDQAAMTSRGCFLDRSKVKAQRGGPDRAFSGNAKDIAAANTHEALLLDYAKTRDVGLNRCRQKAMTKGMLSDKAKMEKCACGEIKRYKFPKEKGRKDIAITIPIVATDLGVNVTVNAPGKVSKCGPLVGKMSKVKAK